MQWIILITTGWLAVVLDTPDVVLPVSPMMPFTLLAAWCPIRSSPCFHARLLYRLWFGGYLRFWQKHHTMPRGVKPRTILLILITLTISLWFIQMPWVRIMLLVTLIRLLFYMRRISVINEKQEKHWNITIAVAIIVYSQYILAFSNTGAGGQGLNNCYF